VNKEKLAILSIVLGVLVGVIGTNIMGVVAAIAIPKGYFNWFQEYLNFQSGYFVLSVVEQFLGFGIIAAIAGYIIGKTSPKNWLMYSGIGYATATLYMIVGNVFIYDVPVINPVVSLSNLNYAIHFIVLSLCFFSVAYVSAKKHNKLSQQDAASVAAA